MDFKDTILQLSEKIAKQKETVATEEATKTAFILPMIYALGYDVFDPTEVVPEMDCDLIKTKGEKIDYAILKDGEPIMLIECKDSKQNLNLHSTQLQKYFVASKSRFGVLTNGVEWRFYTDIDKQNIMDEKPFLIANMSDLSNDDIEQLKKFHKSYYNEQEIISTANELKYMTEIRSILQKEISTPSSSFVEYFVRRVYSGRVYPSVIEQFTPFVKKSFSSVINDIIQDRLNSAIRNEERQENVSMSNEQAGQGGNGIITTQEELDSFEIVKKIIGEKYDTSELTYKDFKSYFLIYNSDVSWWVCRMSLKQYSKAIIFPDETYSGNYERVNISSVEDIYNLKERMFSSMDIAVNRKQRWYNNHK
nr:MAG TPA: hypothetical protein [Caudoviricetes sp.]